MWARKHSLNSDSICQSFNVLFGYQHPGKIAYVSLSKHVKVRRLENILYEFEQQVHVQTTGTILLLSLSNHLILKQVGKVFMRV